MKRMAALIFVLILVLSLTVGCGKEGNNNAQETPPNNTLEKPQEKPQEAVKQTGTADGEYYAEGNFDEKSGWKENVTLKIAGGKIIGVSWNGLHKDGGTDKVTRSKSGEYGLVAKGKAQAEWHEQAAKVEQFLLEKQDPKAIPLNAETGKTDAISGVSITVNTFVELAEKALKDAAK